MDECELIALIATIACAISKCCPEDDISLMSVVFTQLGDTLATVLTQREIRNGNNGGSDNNGRGKNISMNGSGTNLGYNNCTIYYKDPEYNKGSDSSANNSFSP